MVFKSNFIIPLLLASFLQIQSAVFQDWQQEHDHYTTYETEESLPALRNVQDDAFSNYIAISLGLACETALQLRRTNLSTSFFPFDWIQSNDFSTVTELIKNKFKDFLAPETIADFHIIGQFRTHHVVRYQRFDVEFFHDFTSNTTIEDIRSKVKEKYDRRIARFYDALQSKKHICFFRRKITKEQAAEFCFMMKSSFPETKYTLVAIDENVVTSGPWQLEHVIYAKYRPPYLYQGWEGNNALWDVIFHASIPASPLGAQARIDIHKPWDGDLNSTVK